MLFGGLSFDWMRRIIVLGNCCVSTDFGETHQWAKAHILVCGPFSTAQLAYNLLVSWDLKSIKFRKLRTVSRRPWDLK